MLECLKNHLPVINIVLNMVSIVIPILIVLRILRPILDSKSRMKKKIIQKLTEGYKRGKLLFPEIGLRDNLLFRPASLTYHISLKRFYTLFIESIRELQTEGEIVRVSNSELELIIDEREEKYPSYPSKAKKMPVDYGLKEDDPKIYLGLGSPDVKNHIAHLKNLCRLVAAKI